MERDHAERQTLEVEVSALKERIARELHDGVGADLMALVVHLRHHAESRAALGPLAADAQMTLEELRCAAWLFRPEHTVGALEALVESSCRRLCWPVRFAWSRLGGDAERPVGPTAAAATARELVRSAARLAGARHVRVSFDARHAFELVGDVDGVEASTSFESVERVVRDVSGTLRRETQSMGLRLTATLPFSP